MAAKNRLHKPSIGKLGRRRFIGVIHRGNHVTTAGEILKEKCVIGERTCITVAEDKHRMWALSDGRILATVRLELRQPRFHELRKVAPNRRRGISRWLAALTNICRIPEPC